MLTVRYCDDEAELSGLFERLGEKKDLSGVIAVLDEDGEARGYCRLRLTGEVARIDGFGVTGGNESLEADFLFRAVLLKLSGGQAAIEAPPDDRLTAFGFVLRDGRMRALPGDVRFPSGHDR